MTPRFDVESFEQVAAGARTVLLRITGRWSGPAPERLPAPLLVIDAGGTVHRLAPLAGPQGSAVRVAPEGVPWRASFSAPSEVLAGDRLGYGLEIGVGATIALSAPTLRAGTPPPTRVVAPTIAHRATAAAALAAGVAARARAERDAARAALAQERDDARALAARFLAQAREALAAAQAARAALVQDAAQRDALLAQVEALQEAIDEAIAARRTAEARVGEVEARLAVLEQERAEREVLAERAAELAQRLEETERERDGYAEQAAVAREEHERLTAAEATRFDLEHQLQAARGERTALVGALAAAHEQLSTATQDGAATAAERDRLAGALAEAHARAASLEAEVARLRPAPAGAPPAAEGPARTDARATPVAAPEGAAAAAHPTLRREALVVLGLLLVALAAGIALIAGGVTHVWP